ncbi:MAG: hypothetical protein IJG45_06530 [Oscillospiraceae bacterium]|nr:hypothetical protein [Oscillospiraceae bacterium]
MTADLIRSLLISLGFTLLLELGAAFVLGVRDKRDFLLLLLVNVVTNPPLVLTLDLWYIARGMPPWYLIGALELAATAAEWLLLRRRLAYQKLSPLLLIILLNTISFSGGLLL